MYKPLLYYVVGSPSKDDSTRSGPAFGSVGSVVFLKGLGGVAPTHGFNRNPFTFCGRTSLVSVPSVIVPFSTASIQYGPVQRKRSFPGSFPMHVWNMSTALPIVRTARLSTRVSPTVRSCCNRTHSEASSDIRSLTCLRQLRILNATDITTSNPYAKRNGVPWTLFLKLVR